MGNTQDTPGNGVTDRGSEWAGAVRSIAAQAANPCGERASDGSSLCVGRFGLTACWRKPCHTVRTLVPARACARWRALRCTLAALRRHETPGKVRMRFRISGASLSSLLSIHGVTCPGDRPREHRRIGRAWACSTRGGPQVVREDCPPARAVAAFP